jgi:cytochrome c oxidase cbb3-type subunit 4
MYKAILQSLDDVTLFPIVAILIFFTFFVMLFVWVFKMDKKKVNHLAAMPLDQEAEEGAHFNLHS